MRMRRMSFLFTLAAAVLAGCANAPLARPATLTYETTPEGATLYESGQAIGTAPVTRTYPSDGKADTIRTPLVTAVWPSGAKESYYTLVPPGADRVATIARPANAPGLRSEGMSWFTWGTGGLRKKPTMLKTKGEGRPFWTAFRVW